MSMKRPNQHEHLPGGVTAIFMQYKRETLRCVIDTEDYDKVKGYRWHARKNVDTFYARTHVRKPDGKETIRAMHNLVLPGAELVDHINCDGLDNQRRNLRPASTSQNVANSGKRTSATATSPYKGVTWQKDRGKWKAQIRMNGRNQHLGVFDTEEAAAHAYNKAALEAYGQYAALNWLPQLPVEREPGAFVPQDSWGGSQ